MARKTLRQYLALVSVFTFFQGLHFATYVLFLTEKKMDLLQINLINMLYMASVFVLEVPTGSIADVFGRKTSMALGYIFGFMGFLAYYLADCFWLFVLAEFILAIEATLLSGATDAWLINSMKHHRFKGDFNKVFRLESIAKRSGIIAGTVAGAYMGNINLALPWLFSAFGVLLCAVFCIFFIKEEYFEKPDKTFKISKAISSVTENSQVSIAYGIKNKSILYLTLFSVTLAMSIQAFNMQWSLVLKNEHSFMVSETGWFFAIMSVCVMLGNFISVRFANFFRDPKNALLYSQLPTAIGMFIASITHSLSGVFAGFITHEIGRGCMEPIKKAYLNERIPDKTRAAVNSFDSMLVTGGAAIGLLLSGFAAKYLSIRMTWLLSASFLFSSIILFLRMKNGK